MKKRGLDSGRWLKHHAPMYSAPRLGDSWYAKAMSAVRQWPAVQQEHRELERDLLYQRRGLRSAENIVDCYLPSARQRIYSAVGGAINECRHIHHGSTATKFIALRYWQGDEVSMTNASKMLGLAGGRAGQMERLFLGRVARRLGHVAKKGRDGCVR